MLYSAEFICRINLNILSLGTNHVITLYNLYCFIIIISLCMYSFCTIAVDQGVVWCNYICCFEACGNGMAWRSNHHDGGMAVLNCWNDDDAFVFWETWDKWCFLLLLSKNSTLGPERGNELLLILRDAHTQTSK